MSPKSVPQARKEQKSKKTGATTRIEAKKVDGQGSGIKKKTKAGQPTAYKPEYVELAHNYCLLGATDNDLARLFDVDERTITNWKEAHDEFFLSIKSGKDEADSKVAERLFKRATGYSHPDVHISNFQGQITQTPLIKHYPPDATSAIFWLKNRQKAKWRDNITHSGDPDAPLLGFAIIPAKSA